MNAAPQAAPISASSAAMFEIIEGFWFSRAVYIAAKLGIADLVSERPRSAVELAAATQSHAPSLYRILRALASRNIFTEDASGRFSMTPAAVALQSEARGSLRAFLMTELGEEHYPAWGNLLHTVKTGETAFDCTFKMSPWEFFSQNPENAAIFDRAMTNVNGIVNAAIVRAYDFSRAKLLVDVAGGQGTLMAAVLKSHFGVRGILLDMPHVIEATKRILEAEGLGARCQVVAGDIFKSVPAGGDLYLMKWIIHDWDNERSVAILKNCRAAMEAHGKLILVEAVLPPGNQHSMSKFFDLNMLVMTGGRERSESEYKALFQASGFRLTRIIPTQSEFSLIEGAPV
jgi:hypothetical protein